MNIPEKTARVKTALETPQANPWTARISVVALHPTRQDGPVKAFASVQLAEALVINDCKIIQQAGQKAWVRLPDRQRSDGQGYAAVVKALDARLLEAISAAVLEAWTASAGGAE